MFWRNYCVQGPFKVNCIVRPKFQFYGLSPLQIAFIFTSLLIIVAGTNINMWLISPDTLHSQYIGCNFTDYLTCSCIIFTSFFLNYSTEHNALVTPWNNATLFWLNLLKYPTLQCKVSLYSLHWMAPGQNSSFKT